MEKKLTKRQFINQFPYRCDLSGCDVEPVLDSTVQGVEVYRLLNLLIIKVNGQYYSHD